VSQTADQLPDFKVRNSFYRAELERQIQEKREAEKRRREREAYEEERLLMKIEADREKVRREYLDEIDKKRIAVLILSISLKSKYLKSLQAIYD